MRFFVLSIITLIMPFTLANAEQSSQMSLLKAADEATKRLGSKGIETENWISSTGRFAISIDDSFMDTFLLCFQCHVLHEICTEE